MKHLYLASWLSQHDPNGHLLELAVGILVVIGLSYLIKPGKKRGR